MIAAKSTDGVLPVPSKTLLLPTLAYSTKVSDDIYQMHSRHVLPAVPMMDEKHIFLKQAATVGVYII